MEKKDIIVVIPIYKALSETEACALRQCIEVLGDYPTTLLHPESFDPSAVLALAPTFQVTPMADKWFTSVASYNELLLSEEFYARYSHYQYMLIYQLDAFVFRDELLEWANKGYDYIGAPWMPNAGWYHATLERVVDSLQRLLASGNSTRVSHAQMRYRVGNGGFSLRRIAKMREITAEYRALIASLPRGKKISQEDVFFSLYIVKRAKVRVPKWREALAFSFENNAAGSYRKLGNKLPFGCHYWPKKKYWEGFWKDHIPCKID